MNSHTSNKELDYFSRQDDYISAILSYLDRRVIDHPYINRLKEISFLGILKRIYSIESSFAATRYSHTLSVAYLSLQYCNKLNLDEVEIIIVLLVALLHDIGHGPFSHSIETYLTMWQGYKVDHENKVLPNKFEKFLKNKYEFLPSVITNKYSQSELAKILYYSFKKDFSSKNIANIFKYPTDPDNLDGINRAYYLLRDAGTGIDIQPMNPLRLIDDAYRIMYDTTSSSTDKNQSKTSLEKFYQLERKLFEKVFYSTTILAAEAMLCRAIELIYPSHKHMPYQDLTDLRLERKILGNPKSMLLWNWICSENPQYLFVPFSFIDPVKSKSLTLEYGKLQKPGNMFYKTKKNFEAKLAKELGLDPELVIFHSYYSYHWHLESQAYLYNQTSLFEIETGINARIPTDNRYLTTTIYVPQHNKN